MKTGTTAAHRRADGALAGAFLTILLGSTLCAAVDLYTDDAGAATSAVHPVAQSPVELAAVRMGKERACLAEAMYYEARGEGTNGEKAVAEVILARVQSRYYPSSICTVVHQGANKPGTYCQFTYACDGSENEPKEAIAWEHSKRLAALILAGQVKLGGETGHAIAYHNTSVWPAWSATMQETAQIGNHVFYRFMPLHASLKISTPPQPQADVAVPSGDVPLASMSGQAPQSPDAATPSGSL